MGSAGCRIWLRAIECSFCFAFLPVFDAAVWFWFSSGDMLVLHVVLVTCFSVTGFFLAFGVTVPAWPRLSGYVERSQVTDDLDVWEWRKRVTVTFCLCCFFG
jgi:hypothetical protein